MSAVETKIAMILKEPKSGNHVILTKPENVLEVMKGLSPAGTQECTGEYVKVGEQTFWVKDFKSPVSNFEYTLSAAFEGTLTDKEKANYSLWRKNAKQVVHL